MTGETVSENRGLSHKTTYQMHPVFDFRTRREYETLGVDFGPNLYRSFFCAVDAAVVQKRRTSDFGKRPHIDVQYHTGIDQVR
ncbi:MAG: hypothetical protein BWX77_00939 [Bacteroidetes bacterium ADurb.Bin090]|nr:MAG: hypothetical protein BWX77_00939 [Bacteroidetes bacterium ADurb.Bin090]